jgi:ribosomal protein L11 methyltransferase
MTWWKLTFEPHNVDTSSDELDGLGFELMELGAASTAIEALPLLSCFVDTDQGGTGCAPFVSCAEALGFRLLSKEPVPIENWHQSCSEVWQPIVIGTLTIIPVESLDDARPIPAGAIRIIPGQGFGTGHHPTTRMILEELSQLAASGAGPVRSQILDIGTGSGILALSAAKLFSVPVLGTDIDAAALENARDNITINELGSVIRLENAPLSHYSGPFAMVIANVYGEVLCELASEIRRVAAHGSHVLLSGITELVKDQVLEAYSPPGWVLERERCEDGWVCLVLRRL